VALKRTAEDRNELQKLLRAGSHLLLSRLLEWLECTATVAVCDTVHMLRCRIINFLSPEPRSTSSPQQHAIDRFMESCSSVIMSHKSKQLLI